MPHWKTIIRRGVFGSVLVSALLVLLVLLLPHLVNFQWIKQATLTRISQTLGGDVGFQRMELRFFPQPKAVIYDANVSFPNGIQGEVAALNIYPRLWSLLKGDIHITTLRFVSPHLTISSGILNPEATSPFPS